MNDNQKNVIRVNFKKYRRKNSKWKSSWSTEDVYCFLFLAVIFSMLVLGVFSVLK